MYIIVEARVVLLVFFKVREKANRVLIFIYFVNVMISILIYNALEYKAIEFIFRYSNSMKIKSTLKDKCYYMH